MASTSREMAFRVRSSKFRHIYGNSTRKDGCYEGIKITKNAHDGNFCAVNPKFLSVVIESAGGGSFVCLPLERTGRVDANCPKVSGHKGPVLDIKWNPFNDHIIASSSDDSTVKVWKIPEHGLRTNLTDWIVDLHGHNRRVGYIEWHPTAENILLSLGYDHKCVIWNVEQAEPVNVIQKHTDTIYSAAWNRDGSLFATTCKDKMLRVIDPRCGDIISENTGHQGSKASKVLFLGDTNKLFTTGFSKMSERQYAIWDIKNMTKPMRLENVDFSSGVLLPFYDHDTRVMFLAGKGDGNIRYYELVSDAPYCHFLSQYQSSAPQRGLGAMPKRGCDASRCEIMRFYKLHADKFICEPISMIVPRRSEQFQDDIFPPTTSSIASLTADEWVSGLNREPILISMQDGEITNDPKTSASKAVQKQDGALLNAPSITTYKAIDKTRLHTHPVSAVNGLDSPEHPHYPRNRPPPMTNHVSPVVQTRSKEPDSMKNIRRLSANVGEMEVDVHLQADPHLDSVAEKMSMFENISEMSSPNSTPEKMETTKSRSSPRKRVSHGNENTPNGLGLSSETEPHDSPSVSPSSPTRPRVNKMILPLSPRDDIEIIDTSPSPGATPMTPFEMYKTPPTSPSSNNRFSLQLSLADHLNSDDVSIKDDCHMETNNVPNYTSVRDRRQRFFTSTPFVKQEMLSYEVNNNDDKLKLKLSHQSDDVLPLKSHQDDNNNVNSINTSDLDYLLKCNKDFMNESKDDSAILSSNQTSEKLAKNLSKRSTSLRIRDKKSVATLLLKADSAIECEDHVSFHKVKIHVKKVWSTPAPRNSPPVQEVIGIPKTDPELRKAYFRQVEEINSLKDQVSLKDKRIRQLEYELNVLRDLSTEVDESNC